MESHQKNLKETRRCEFAIAKQFLMTFPNMYKYFASRKFYSYTRDNWKYSILESLQKSLYTYGGTKKTSMLLSLTVCGRDVKQMRVMMMSRAVRFGFIHVLVHGSRWRARERAREYRVQVTCKFICFTTSSRAARWRYGPRVGVSKACWRTRVACETEGRAARGRLLLRCLACANARVAGAATPRSLRRAQGCRRGA